MASDKRPKHIVSKREYVKVQTIRFGMNIGFLCLLLLMAYCGFTVYQMFLLSHGYLLFTATTLFYAFCIGLFGWCLTNSFRAINSVQKVVLISNVNSADLPAHDSLVRASEEPVQEQQSILLRPAIAVDASPPEQLLRSSIETVETKD